MQLSEFLISKGYPQAVACPLDGAYHRFDHAGSLSGWFKGVKVGEVRLAAFGDFKISEKFEYKESGAGAITPEQEAELATFAAQAEVDRKLRQEKAAKECQADWDDAIDRGTAPYLKRKGLNKLYGAKICSDFLDTLMVPARDIDGKLWTIQRIFPKPQEPGKFHKLFKKEGSKTSNFHVMGTIQPKEAIYIGEGYATCASIFEALGEASAVVVAFDTGNLSAVGRALHARYPEAPLIFCADDDERPGQPEKGNPGLEAATQAALETGALIRSPRFKVQGSGTDFNDLMLAEGLAVVREQLLNPPPAVQGEEKPPEKKVNSEKDIAGWVFSRYPGTLIRQDKNLFLYQDGFWRELDSGGIDDVKNTINAVCGNKLPSKTVESIYKTFFRSVLRVPDEVNLFQPRRDLANFRNGTLHLDFRPKTPEELRGSESKGTHFFKLRFAPHQATDYCTTVLPIDYAPLESLPENGELYQMFKNVWPEGTQEKVELYEEILGACLIPNFPQAFFFLGAPKTGKSTLIMLLSKLVGEKNSAHSDPTRWGRGFGLQSMVNTLVNTVTDIANAPLPDDLAKQGIDGVHEVERKHKTSVKVRLPAVHAWGANTMPKSAEAGTGVYERRFSILRTDTVQPGQGGGGTFSDWIWGRGPDGVLKAALRGLERLLSNGGIYSKPESAKAEMKDWGVQNSLVQQFIGEIEGGQVRGPSGGAGVHHGGDIWVIDPRAKVPSQIFYTRFIEYVSMVDPGAFRRGSYPSLIGFSRTVRHDKRFGAGKTETQRYVTGCGVVGGEGASF